MGKEGGERDGSVVCRQISVGGGDNFTPHRGGSDAEKEEIQKEKGVKISFLHELLLPKIKFVCFS